ncbi:hypothetical protein SAMN05444920_103299 [Nonomuraea solani]|uniref:Uncharacterized protein n=1 Tax=Nonomuraea solani TaxID=1144553 RepID=A0A1H6BC43_9ACTN|nr:hypothetical protein [Nonomuraea solani]SEG58318.1 hypothetical protein SAMN05444920_103299 [Nonomuraea solani]
MGKYDGMDPKLVRDLLAEVKHAARQLRTVEDRVRLAMSRAGLSSQATHRPVQVAEAADTMVKDVNVRLETLEKRADPPRAGDEPKDVREDQDRYDNPRADGESPGKTGDDPPPKTGDESPPKTGVEPPSKGDESPPETGAEPPSKGDEQPGAGDEPKDVREDRDRYDNPRADGESPGDTRDDPPPKTGVEPPSKGEEPPKADVEPPSKGDEQPGTGDEPSKDPDGKVCDDPGDDTGEQPKDDDSGSRRDRGAEADGGATDTPAKDAITKPQVVVVDGVKVLQVPLDPPTAAQLEDMLENPDAVKPAEMPRLPADATDAITWADDGSDVVSATANPPNLDALQTIVENHRDIAPQDLPDLEVPSGTASDGGSTAEVSDTPTATDGTCDSAKDTPPDGRYPTPDLPTNDTPTQDSDPGQGAGQGSGTGGGQGIGEGRDTGAGQGVCDDRGAGADQGAGGGQGAGDGRGSGGREPGGQGGGGQDTGDQGSGGQGKPVTIPPTEPSVETPNGATDDTPGTAAATPGTAAAAPGTAAATPGTAAATPGTAAAAESGYGAESAYGPETCDGGAVADKPEAGAGAEGEPVTRGGANVAYDVTTGDGVRVQVAFGGETGGEAGPGVGVWAVDGSEVVSVDVTAPGLDALQTVIEHHRDIQPADMPSVQIPPGEYDEGAWPPGDVRPDGPPGSVGPGSVGPGTPERSA